MPNGLQRLVFIKGPTYANAFAKARRFGGLQGGTARAGHLGDTPATDSDAKGSAGSLLIDEVLGDGTILYAGGSTSPVRASGGGSLQQTNFFEGIQPTPLGEVGGAGGGGGAGGVKTGNTAADMTARTAKMGTGSGGGGGGSPAFSLGGPGGSGCIIIKYPSS